MSDLTCPQCNSDCDSGHKFCFICGFPLQEVGKPDGEDPLIGTTLPGGFTMLELVGVGGMGRVYRAEQKVLNRTVAVKIIHPHLLGDENAAARFITEARAASQLNHPNSVAVIDFGRDGNQLYLVMEFLRGHDMARVAYEEGPLPFPRIIDVMVQVLAALSEAHHLGIVHRDLKPENIVLEPMRTGGDFVKVVDFGLAKMRDTQQKNLTSPGIVCGTPDYMAPEQGRGDAIDSRSDLYACGVILFQLLTGRLPFEAESPTQVVLMHITLPPPDPERVAPDRKIPRALSDITLKALSKNPADRYQDAEAFATALKSALPTARASLKPLDTTPCPSCGAGVPIGQKFCGECGNRLSSIESLTPSRASPVPPSVPALPLPFTGRTDDLDWLEASLLEARGTAVVARIIAEAGVGKTRLLEEFADRVRGQAFFSIVGPDPWGAGVSYHALRRAICLVADLPPDGGEPMDWSAATTEARRGLMEVFGRGLRTSRAGTSDLAPEDVRFLAAEALRWGLRAGMTRVRSPLILAIDDLHAIDGASRAAFADVASEPPPCELLLLATHPPQLDPGWPGSTLELKGLSTQLATALMRSDAHATATSRATSERTRTVPPLYLDQLVRFTLEGGSAPPPRLGDLVAQRIERLPRDARRLLQALAVTGDEVPLAAVRMIAKDVSTFDESLSALTASGIANTRSGSLLIGHPLFRDVALATIPAEVRRELHQRALEDTTVVLPLEVRAQHAFHAQNSFEALMLLEQVAERAGSRGDGEGQILALRRGLDLARREIFRGELDDPVRAVLMFSRKLGDTLSLQGDLNDADGVLREALGLADPGSTERAQIIGSLALVAHRRGRRKEAEALLLEGRQLARSSRAGQDVARSLDEVERAMSATR